MGGSSREQFEYNLLTNLMLGAVHKVRHARGLGPLGVREGVTVCDMGRGIQEHVRPHLKKQFHTYVT